MMRVMTRHLLAAALLFQGVGASACPLCLGWGKPSTAQQLVATPQAVLALPTADAGRFRVIQVIKGERPADGMVEGGYPAPVPLPATRHRRTPGRCCSCVTTRCRRGSSSARLTPLAPTGCVRSRREDRAAERSPEEWRARVALVVPHLNDPEPLAAELASAELGAAPYPALRAAKPLRTQPLFAGAWRTRSSPRASRFACYC